MFIEIMQMITVTLFMRAGCHLCEQAEQELMALQEKIPHRLVLIDVDSDPFLKKTYAMDVPVVETGPYRLKAPFTRQDLIMTLGASNERREQLERINDKAYQVNIAQQQKVTNGEKLSYWISKHYLALVNLFLLFYVGIPFLAPIFKKAGWDSAAEVVYKIYAPLCHQWAFRSWFLFGEQAYYPHAAAKIPNVMSFETAAGITDENDPSRLQARIFKGNPILGYKIALCERDLAIWGSLLLFGVIYAVVGRRIPKLHWLIWICLGIMPIALDGLSQILSQIPIRFIQAFLPYRESTPFLRTLTGFLFGVTTAWFGFPQLEEAMLETRLFFSKRIAAAKK